MTYPIQTEPHQDGTSPTGDVEVGAPHKHSMEMRPLLDESEKICRICLDDEDPQHMIAPCLCKGSSKWVHRDCLDRWRANEVDRAWSQCTECMFQYRMKPSHEEKNWNKFKFYVFVSRDVFLITLVWQLLIILLGGIVALADSSDLKAVRFLDKACVVDAHHWCQWSIYYLYGLFLFFMLLGFAGSIRLCQHECDAVQAVNTAFEPSRSRYGERSSHYFRQRQRGRRRSPTCDDSCYVCDPGPCCWSCNGCTNGCHHSDRGCSGNCSGNCPTAPSGGGGGDKSTLLIVLAVVAIILALIGFVVGTVLTVVIFQKIWQRHMFVLQKGSLAKSFAILDLSKQHGNLENTVKVPPPSSQTPPTSPPGKRELRSDGDDPLASFPTPTAPLEQDFLSQEDRLNLETLGLMESVNSSE